MRKFTISATVFLLMSSSVLAAPPGTLPVGAGVQFTCDIAAPSPAGTPREWIRCADGVMMYTTAGNVDIPVGTSLLGDVTGTLLTTSVVGLQGRSLSAAAPSTNQCVMWSGAAWGPGTITDQIAYNGGATTTMNGTQIIIDAAGSFPSPTPSPSPMFTIKDSSQIDPTGGQLVAFQVLSDGTLKGRMINAVEQEILFWGGDSTMESDVALGIRQSQICGFLPPATLHIFPQDAGVGCTTEAGGDVIIYGADGGHAAGGHDGGVHLGSGSAQNFSFAPPYLWTGYNDPISGTNGNDFLIYTADQGIQLGTSRVDIHGGKSTHVFIDSNTGGSSGGSSRGGFWTNMKFPGDGLRYDIAGWSDAGGFFDSFWPIAGRQHWTMQTNTTFADSSGTYNSTGTHIFRVVNGTDAPYFSVGGQGHHAAEVQGSGANAGGPFWIYVNNTIGTWGSMTIDTTAIAGGEAWSVRADAGTSTFGLFNQTQTKWAWSVWNGGANVNIGPTHSDPGVPFQVEGNTKFLAKITTYNNEATDGQGVVDILKKGQDVVSTGGGAQTTTIATFTPGTSGIYRVMIIISCTTADTVTATVTYTDAVNTTAQTITPISSAACGTNGTVTAIVPARANTSTALAATLTLSSQATTKASATIERLN